MTKKYSLFLQSRPLLRRFCHCLAVALAFTASAAPMAQEEYDPIEDYSKQFNKRVEDLNSEMSESVNSYIDDKLKGLGVGDACGIDFSLAIPISVPDLSCEKIMPRIGFEADFSYDVPRPDAFDAVEGATEKPDGFD